MKAVILAGGKGTRLRPYTTNFPKPLMPIGDQPILEIVIEKLKENDIKDIIITTGHLEELIRAFFNDGSRYGVRIRYSMESEPLGTAGPLYLIGDQLDDTFLLMNGDILSDINLKDLISFHKKRGGIATVAIIKRTVNIDFGVVNISKDRYFQKWEEKPEFNFYVSMGINVLEPDALNFIPQREFLNLPDLINTLHINGHKISTYVHEGFWLDIGRPDDYEQASQLYERGN